ncbi:unnamed protein product [Phytophthora fragariaefolia]|uniref:Unnamed protein product n=1 Tax=Phytophthora fragariaefolia TaxID=1490495 RepID=A0A9W6WNC6_9STRA|nr:unnamed protein product [Phytophthora fragariaefolia]
MDWEANLAAIIRCTDASLEQQFRQFEDVTADLAAEEAPPPAPQQHQRDPGDNVAAAYLRETMAADYRSRQQEQRKPQYTRVSGAFARGPATSVPVTTSFSEHFHRQQERKRGAAAAGRARDNQRTHRRGNEYRPAEEDVQEEDHDVDESRYAPARHTAGSGMYHHQMYASPTYDMAQMMEQVRLSLKLEVDARAAIAERQLSALLQLCKATSEELDRLRVEVCANDRQLHTLDQVQSKIRQELTTQKDIGFHLQSMCGKDESWRMQTENQLLELRQMVAALREQGNSTQAVAQEKLSRSELLVQFNAAMEPIKAQLQANLQHQAQQIAEITRTASSSSLLLDGITQKVNRGITDELNELRGDFNALKHHVAKLDIFQDGGRLPQFSKEEAESKAKEEQQQQEKKLADTREALLKELTSVSRDYVDSQIQPLRKVVDNIGSRLIGKQELDYLSSILEDGCRKRCAAAVTETESQLKATQERLRGECSEAMREISDRIEKSVQQAVDSVATTLEKQTHAWQNRQLDFDKLIQSEQKERKHAFDELNESLRKSRHQLEDQIHTLTQDIRTKMSQHESGIEKRLNGVEKQTEDAVTSLQKENQTTVANLKTSLNTQSGKRDAEWEQKLKRLEDTVSGTSVVVAALSKSVASCATTITPTPSNDSSAKEVSLALEKQTSVYVSTMENLLQKMQLQLQLQTQSQVQMAMAPSPYHGFWPSSPYAASHAPTLQLPPAVKHSVVGNPTELPSVSMGAVQTKSTPEVTSSSSSHHRDFVTEAMMSTAVVKGAVTGEKCEDRAILVEQVEHPNTTPRDLNKSLPIPSPLPAISSEVAVESSSASGHSDLHSTNENAIDPSMTGHTVVKGALAEAELAMARVENRRKIEQEAKLQVQLPPAPIAVVTPQVKARMEFSALNNTNSTESSNRRSSVPGVLTEQTPPLTRSASISALPVKGTEVHAISSAVEGKRPTPGSIPSSPMTPGCTITAPPPPPPSIPQQTLTKTQGSAATPAVSITPLSPTESKPLMASTSTISTPKAGPKSDINPARPPLALSVPKPALPEQNISVPETSTETNPPLSPLAKIFARSKTPCVDDKDFTSSGMQTRSNSTLTQMSEAGEQANQQHLSLVPSPVSTTAASFSGVQDTPIVSHVLCSLCRLPVPSDQKAEHEKSQCPKRLVVCVSCKQQMQWVDLEIHELDCKNEKAEGINIGTTKSPPIEAEDNAGSLKKCRHCSADVPSLDLLEHEINCDKVLKQCPHCLRRQKVQSSLSRQSSVGIYLLSIRRYLYRCQNYRSISKTATADLFPVQMIVVESFYSAEFQTT